MNRVYLNVNPHPGDLVAAWVHLGGAAWLVLFKDGTHHVWPKCEGDYPLASLEKNPWR